MANSRRVRYVRALDRLQAARPDDAREVADYVRYLRQESIRFRLALRAEQARHPSEAPS